MKISSTSCNGSWYSITNLEGICLLLAAGFVLSFFPFVCLGLPQLCNTRLFLAALCLILVRLSCRVYRFYNIFLDGISGIPFYAIAAACVTGQVVSPGFSRPPNSDLNAAFEAQGLR